MTSLKTTQECVITFTNLIQTSSNLQQKKKKNRGLWYEPYIFHREVISTVRLGISAFEIWNWSDLLRSQLIGSLSDPIRWILWKNTSPVFHRCLEFKTERGRNLHFDNLLRSIYLSIYRSILIDKSSEFVMAIMAALELDLRALSLEARRGHPAVKDAAEHVILKVRYL